MDGGNAIYISSFISYQKPTCPKTKYLICFTWLYLKTPDAWRAAISEPGPTAQVTVMNTPMTQKIPSEVSLHLSVTFMFHPVILKVNPSIGEDESGCLSAGPQVKVGQLEFSHLQRRGIGALGWGHPGQAAYLGVWLLQGTYTVALIRQAR